VEFDLRDWLLILGPVFVSGVLIHGYWRMRRGKGDLKMSLDKSFLGTDDDEKTTDDLSFLKAELPNGGARILQDETPISALDPEELDLDKDVPVLLEPVVLGDEIVTGEPDEDEILVRRETLEGESIGEGAGSEQRESVTEASVAKAPPARKATTLEKPEMFVVINVLAHEEFDGQGLLEALSELDMTFGEMDIFHRLSDEGTAEFSLVNVVEPGTFNPAQMNQLKTPGVTLFMRAHELPEPIRVYDAMIETAQTLATELGGEMKDQSRSAMTSQTIEHQRQGIQDFQYKHSA
jgi:cell division protein ZipA